MALNDMSQAAYIAAAKGLRMGREPLPSRPEPRDGFDLTYLSLGGGVQSTALLICSALGLHGVPRADCAVFADTKGELRDTYRHLVNLRRWAGPRGIPLVYVSRGSLEKGCLEGGVHSARAFSSIPRYTMEPGTGKRGILRRQCTSKYKIEMITKAVRAVLGLRPRQRAAGKVRVRAMIGISLDEAIRMKPSRDAWVTNTFPLVDARLTRESCKAVIAQAGMDVPVKSACWFCPFHDDRYWAWLKRERPAYFERAVAFDAKIRDSSSRGVTHPCFLHPSLKPLSEVDFEPRNGKAQLVLDGFNQECEGVCGV